MGGGLAWHSQSRSGRVVRPPSVVQGREWGPFVRDPSGLWLLPDGARAVTPLSGVALGSPDYQYPTKQDWTNGLSAALQWIDSPTKNMLAEQAQSLATSIDLMGTIFTEVAGVDPGVAVSLEQGIKIAELVWGIADRVIGLSTVLESAGDIVGNTVAQIGEAIPILGQAIQVITAIWGIAQSIQRQEAAQAAEALKRAQVACRNQCKTRFDRGHIDGTGPGNKITPSDLFRDIAIRGPSQAGSFQFEMPHNLGSMYVLMCAPETEGYGISRSEYLERLGQWRRQQTYGMFTHHISARTKKQMWALIKGVMAGVEEPGVKPITGQITSDNGRSIMPVLQEILRRELLKGTWDANTAKYLGRYLAGGCDARECYEGTCATWDASCVSKLDERSRLGHRFYQSIQGWGETLEEAEIEWRAGASARAAARTDRMRAALTSGATHQLLKKVAETEEVSEASRRAEAEKKELRNKILRGVAGVSGSAAAGYLAWTGMRMFGPKKRR
jgi:hypothetical protein